MICVERERALSGTECVAKWGIWIVGWWGVVCGVWGVFSLVTFVLFAPKMVKNRYFRGEWEAVDKGNSKRYSQLSNSMATEADENRKKAKKKSCRHVGCMQPNELNCQTTSFNISTSLNAEDSLPWNGLTYADHDGSWIPLPVSCCNGPGSLLKHMDEPVVAEQVRMDNLRARWLTQRGLATPVIEVRMKKFAKQKKGW